MLLNDDKLAVLMNGAFYFMNGNEKVLEQLLKRISGSKKGYHTFRKLALAHK